MAQRQLLPDPNERTGDDAIRSTDDDAAASRASCASLGYVADPFAPLFVRRVQRRPPLINVGTFLRTWALDTLVARFLDTVVGAEARAQIVSLGAGTDTRFFRLCTAADGERERALARYVEVDFMETTARKVRTIMSQDALKACLTGDVGIAQGGAELVSDIYALLPGDLRTFASDLGPRLFEPTLDRPALLRRNLPTLVIAECVFIYLPPEQSASLLSWAASFVDAAMVLYDPAALDDSFGRIMVSNLRSRGIELHGLQSSPAALHQPQRFLSTGFARAQAADLSEIRRTRLPRRERERIAKLEMLDEVEELDLVLSHYVLAWATTGDLMADLTVPVQPRPPPSATPSLSSASDSSFEAS